MSPAMAAASALVGKLADVRTFTTGFHSPPQKEKGSPRREVAHVSDIESDADLDNVLDLPEDSQGNSVSSKAPSTAGLPPFTKLQGIAAPMDRANVDTDAIIPKQFLKTIKRSGLGSALFHGWRYDPATGKEDPDFVLNKAPYRNSKILVCTGPNFGCGSSREHAPWALLDFGIWCVIAPSFGDIFFNNTFKNGMLPIKIENQDDINNIAAVASSGQEIEVDLEAQVVRDADGKEICGFEVEEFRKHCLLNGLDDIGLTMQVDDKIAKFETKRTREWPWLDGSGYLKRGKMVKAAPVPKTNRGQEITEPLEW